MLGGLLLDTRGMKGSSSSKRAAYISLLVMEGWDLTDMTVVMAGKSFLLPWWSLSCLSSNEISAITSLSSLDG